MYDYALENAVGSLTRMLSFGDEDDRADKKRRFHWERFISVTLVLTLVAHSAPPMEKVALEGGWLRSHLLASQAQGLSSTAERYLSSSSRS